MLTPCCTALWLCIEISVSSFAADQHPPDHCFVVAGHGVRCMESLRIHSVIQDSSRRVAPTQQKARCAKSRHHVLNATRERVLRYPDGHERRIIYPVLVTFDEDEDDCSSWDVTGLWRGAAQGSQAAARHQARQQQQQQSTGSERSLKETAAFLEGLFAASYAAQPLEDVAQCYKVLDGCPWVLPRPVFLLTSQQWGWQAADGIQSTYTLRIKVVKEGAADAIAQLLNQQHLAAALDVCEMRDGLVVFECAEDADKFASKLEEEGHSQVMVAEVDSHKMFRMVADVKALAVLLKQGATIPAPYQLAASLKQQKRWEDK